MADSGNKQDNSKQSKIPSRKHHIPNTNAVITPRLMLTNSCKCFNLTGFFKIWFRLSISFFLMTYDRRLISVVFQFEI